MVIIYIHFDGTRWPVEIVGKPEKGLSQVKIRFIGDPPGRGGKDPHDVWAKEVWVPRHWLEVDGKRVKKTPDQLKFDQEWQKTLKQLKLDKGA